MLGISDKMKSGMPHFVLFWLGQEANALCQVILVVCLAKVLTIFYYANNSSIFL